MAVFFLEEGMPIKQAESHRLSMCLCAKLQVSSITGRDRIFNKLVVVVTSMRMNAICHALQATKSPFINAIFDREPLDQFVWGRVALLGEAAHPTTPHGLRRLEPPCDPSSRPTLQPCSCLVLALHALMFLFANLCTCLLMLCSKSAGHCLTTA